MPALRMFIPITKVDAAQRLVYGVATAEIEDRAGEICDYASTKPFYQKWSEEIARSSGGKSLGNLRAMHGPVAAGKITAINFNDEAKQIEICAKVVDDGEWVKVQEGVYTGFSQGGTYERRWTDADGRSRYTAAPNEISLVDLPCLPQAMFEMIKADGTREKRHFRSPEEKAARLARIIEDLGWLHNLPFADETNERDDDQATAELRELAGRMAAILRAALNVSPPDAAQGAQPRKFYGGRLKAAPGLRSPICKAGEKTNASDEAIIQQLHDSAVVLGASCGSGKAAKGAIEKRFDMLAETLADVLQRVRKIEEQPLPLPFLGPARAISKAEDGNDTDPNSSIEELLSRPEALSVLAIKLAQRKGR